MKRNALLAAAAALCAGIAGAQSPTITTSSLPGGTALAWYLGTLAATGGTAPYTWSASGLFSGLAIDAASGQISGYPANAGVRSVTVTVTDQSGLSDTKILSITISPPVTITTASLANGTVGLAYSAAVTASGGVKPYAWSATSLPPGLSIDPVSGLIGGIPTAAGTFNPSIQAVDTHHATASRSYTITIVPPVTITTSSIAAGTAGLGYSVAVTASGGTPPYTWNASSLPPGLSINSQLGVISGTPTTAGAYTTSVTASDVNGSTASNSYNVTIAPPVTITTGSIANGTVGLAYSSDVDASGGTQPYTWSATSLPPGLSINSQSGVISGTPTTAGTYTPNVKATDVNGASASVSYNVTILPPVTITTASLPNGTVGAPYSATAAATGGTTPYTWSATGLPPGLTLNTQNGQIGGTPTTAGNYTPDLHVNDANGATASKSYSVTIATALTIATGSLPGGKVGTAYSASLAASGGTPPYTWSITAGSLPSGLTLNSGQITGTPGAAGTANITVQVSDAGGLTASRNFSIAISSPPPPLTISGTFPGGTVGTAYSHALTASGGTPPYTWSVTSGSLPPGLTLSGSTGTVSGTPANNGSYNFTIQVSDSAGVTKSMAASISIGAAVSVTTTSLPAARVGTSYAQSLAASGGSPPYTWSVTSGALPGGLSLLAAGLISGVPTTAGAFAATIQVQDAGGSTATRQFSITVASNLTITSTSPLPAAAAGSSYSQAMAAISGLPPYTWTVSSGALPQGIALDSLTGLLSGKATSVGTFNFTLTVSDASAAADSKAFTLTVVSALSVSTASLPGGSLNTPYSQTLTAAAGTSPYTWSVTVGSLPPGLTLNAGTGAITGTPNTQGTYNFTVQVKDAVSATATKALTIPIGPALSVTSGPALPAGVLASPYAQTLTASGGTAPYTWSIASGALPAGLALIAATGVVTGTPQAAGTFQFTVQVTDSTRATASANLSLTVAAQGVPAVTITDLPDTAAPLEQPAVGLSLATPYPVALKGQLVLSFAPDAVVEGDDPAIQFSTGGRTVDFTIPANATRAAFPAPAVQLQTGSVAGTITVTARLEAGGADITPNPAPSDSLKISRSAPVIRSVKLVKTASGFEVWITGYAPSREITEATARLTPVAGSNLQTTSVKASMSDAARQWYQDPASHLYGSQFTIVQPFTVVGNANAVASVSVTLANTVGSSNAVSASF